MAEGGAMANASDARREKQRAALSRRHTFAGKLTESENPDLDSDIDLDLAQNPLRIARRISGLRLVDDEEAESIASSKTSTEKGKTALGERARRGSSNHSGPTSGLYWNTFLKGNYQTF